MQGLTKVFSARQGPAIQSVNFDVQNGEVVGFVGLNGAGKTTTIRIAVGVTLPSAGTVIVDGHDIRNQKPEASKNIGWVPETPNYEPNAKAISQLRYLAGYYGISSAEARKKSQDLLTTVGLAGFEKRKIRTYSQGMKKRFSLASSMLSDPQNYLFDEILNGLDPEGIHYFRELVTAQKRANKAILLSSHILTEVQAMADRIVFIHHGQVIQVVKTDELAISAGQHGILRIVLQPVSQEAIDYLKTLGGMLNVQGNTIVLSGFPGDSIQVNAELVKRGFPVREISYEKTGLEQYFFDLIRRVDSKV